MSISAIIVGGRVLGSRRKPFDDWSVPVPPEYGSRDGDPLTLRDLITRIVVAEVQAFRERHEARRLPHVMTRDQIEAGAAKGKVDPGGRDTPGEVNDEQAIGAALQAFEDGMYLVIIDGVEHRDLDAQVFLQPDSRVTFLRLTLLAGG